MNNVPCHQGKVGSFSFIIFKLNLNWVLNLNVFSSIRQKQPTPPPRPSMSSRPMSTQTRHMDENVAALYELQERNMSLQREREALSEALGKMQDELIKSEERSETYRSQARRFL